MNSVLAHGSSYSIGGADSFPRDLIAKALVTDSSDPDRLTKSKHLLDEFLHIYRVCHDGRMQTIRVHRVRLWSSVSPFSDEGHDALEYD
jgi:hypothetical protein